jgi:hypothetical protein
VIRALLALAVTAACGRSNFDARVFDAPPDTPTPSCLPNPRTTLVYATSAYADFATAWSTGGAGTWSVTGNQLVQTNGAVDLAFAYTTVTDADYRVTANVHIVDESHPMTGHAAELALRISPSAQNMYQCNYDPLAPALVINATLGGLGTNEYTHVTPTMAGVTDVILEAQVVGTRIECCANVPGAYAAVDDPQLTTGAAGVKTYFSSAAFDHFAVYH